MKVKKIEYLYDIEDNRWVIDVMKDVEFMEMLYGNVYIHVLKDKEGRLKAVHVGA